MNRSPLLGTTEGVFDSLQVRNPPYSGALVDIASLVGSGGGGSSYDDTQVQADIATNAAAIALKADASALAGKQHLISNGSLTIAHTSALQVELDDHDYKIGLAQAAILTKADTTAMTTALAQKSDTATTYTKSAVDTSQNVARRGLPPIRGRA